MASLSSASRLGLFAPHKFCETGAAPPALRLPARAALALAPALLVPARAALALALALPGDRPTPSRLTAVPGGDLLLRPLPNQPTPQEVDEEDDDACDDGDAPTATLLFPSAVRPALNYPSDADLVTEEELHPLDEEELHPLDVDPRFAAASRCRRANSRARSKLMSDPGGNCCPLFRTAPRGGEGCRLNRSRARSALALPVNASCSSCTSTSAYSAAVEACTSRSRPFASSDELPPLYMSLLP